MRTTISDAVCQAWQSVQADAQRMSWTQTQVQPNSWEEMRLCVRLCSCLLLFQCAGHEGRPASRAVGKARSKQKCIYSVTMNVYKWAAEEQIKLSCSRNISKAPCHILSSKTLAPVLEFEHKNKRKKVLLGKSAVGFSGWFRAKEYSWFFPFHSCWKFIHY